MSNVELKDATIEATKVDPKLAFMLNATPNGKFSSIVNRSQLCNVFLSKIKMM